MSTLKELRTNNKYAYQAFMIAMIYFTISMVALVLDLVNVVHIPDVLNRIILPCINGILIAVITRSCWKQYKQLTDSERKSELYFRDFEKHIYPTRINTLKFNYKSAKKQIVIMWVGSVIINAFIMISLVIG